MHEYSRFGEALGFKPSGDLLGGGFKLQWDAGAGRPLHAEVSGRTLVLTGGDPLQQFVIHLIHLMPG